MNIEISDQIKEYFPSGFKTKLLMIVLFSRVLLVTAGILIYNNINLWIPNEVTYRLQLSLIASIIISIIFFLPVQEWLEVKLKKRFLSEYLFDDPLTLRLAYKRFEVEDLITNVFPDMVKFTGSSAGRLVLLSSLGNFEAFTYSKGRRRKIKNQSFHVNNRLLDYLKEHREGAAVSETFEQKEINEDFAQLKASYIIPFIFREKVFGFLTLSNIPEKAAMGTLRILASKAALAVYNHILSSQIAIHKKYKHEFEVASRIEDLIFTTKTPRFLGVKFQTYQKDPNILLEFFRNEEDDYMFVLLAIHGKNRFGSGLVSSHILGKYYSQGLIKKKHNHKSIKVFTEECLEELFWKEGYEMIVGSFRENHSRITFTQVGTNFRIIDSEVKTGNLISVGWKYTLDIKDGSLYIFYKKEKILSITKIKEEEADTQLQTFRGTILR
ncbi:MAG: hypothetical protein H7A24_06980 [Leptospiraceae bacterium]|nr:hypothetical protein [Leptospiraceae bacterium]MCP5511607.1 hypothetical protein [Leptospiraceae bacterium]